MKYSILRKVISLLIPIGLVFMTLSASALARSIELKAATWHPVNHCLTSDAYNVWAEEVNNRTKGEVKFKWFYGGSLVKAPQMHEALKSGLADLAIPIPGWFPNLYPVSQGVSLPFMVDSPLHAAMVLYEMYQTIPEMKKEYSKMVPVGFFSTDVIDIHTVKAPPENLEELRKLKIGCSGPQEIQLMKDLGLVPQHLKISDIYMAVQRGMVDGIVFPDAPLFSWKLTEVISGHTIGEFLTVPFVIGLSKQAWKKLSPESKKTIADLTSSFSGLLGTTLVNEHKRVMDKLKERGDKFYYLTPEQKAKWKELTEQQYGAYVENLNQRGMNGKAILAKIQAIAEKWRNKSYPPESWWGRAGK